MYGGRRSIVSNIDLLNDYECVNGIMEVISFEDEEFSLRLELEYWLLFVSLLKYSWVF